MFPLSSVQLNSQRPSRRFNPITLHQNQRRPIPMPAATMSGRNGRSYTYLKILFLLFLLNSLSLYFYFRPSSTPSPPDLTNRLHDPRDLLLHSTPGASGDLSSGSAASSLMKHWPILPSYLPWTNPSLSPSFRSCEAFFGNGFIKELPVISESSVASRGGGWFRCFFSETLQSSVCEGGSVRMNAEKIKMAKGGERLEEVIGRTEGDEMPVFEDGAFQVEGGDGRKEGESLVDQEFVGNYIGRNKMGELIGSARIVGKGKLLCDEWIEEPTIMVIRFEYANLFHTMTDWYNGYVSSRVTGLPYRPKVVFIDGHCKSPMEETWRAFFSGFTYAKHFHGSVCFRHIIFSPLGYDNAMFKGLSDHIDCSGTSSRSLWVNPDDHKTARLSEFGEMMRAAFNFPLDKPLDRGVSRHNVLFVRREDYLAHPRHSGKPESRLSNEPEVFEALKTWTSSHSRCKVNLVNGLFAHRSMKDQVQAIQDASVIIGAHGAGLTHIVSATPDTVILEIISSQYRRPHFELIAKWKGLDYHAINLSGSYATPSVVVDQLKNILKGLGC